MDYTTYISGIGVREYFFLDYDEAKAFERLFDGFFSYAKGGYKIILK